MRIWLAVGDEAGNWDALDSSGADGGQRLAVALVAAPLEDWLALESEELADGETAKPAINRRSGCTPGQWLVDGGYPAHAQIDRVGALTQGRTAVIAPVPAPRRTADTCRNDDDQPPPPAPQLRKDSDSGALAQWRARMATPAAQERYKQRAATAECVNAQARNLGLQRLPVCGLLKVRALACLYALAHNLTRMLHIAPQMLSRGTGACAAAPAAHDRQSNDSRAPSRR